jgi:hypothetical protein
MCFMFSWQPLTFEVFDASLLWLPLRRRRRRRGRRDEEIPLAQRHLGGHFHLQVDCDFLQRKIKNINDRVLAEICYHSKVVNEVMFAL